jgi:anti-anti-sigma regulatory factor
MAAGAVVTDEHGKLAAVRPETWPIVSFPFSTSSGYRAQRKALLLALRASSGSPVVLDLSPCVTLHQEDIDLLLECMARVAGRDTSLLLVASSPTIRILLEATRISSLVPVFNSVDDAMAFPQPEAGAGDPARGPVNNIAEVRE